VTEHLKDRFRILLGVWMRKRSEKEFEEMRKLIENFDFGEVGVGEARNPKRKKTDIAKGEVNLDLNAFNLDVIQEQTHDELEDSKTFDAFESNQTLP